MKDKYPFVASGKISISRVTPDNVELVLTSKNTVVPNAAILLSYILSGGADGALTTIELFNGLAISYQAPITTKSHDGSYRVTFEALIGTTDFAGTIDNARLAPTDSGTLGHFAEVSFDPFTKLNTEQVIIQWQVDFNPAP